MEARDLALAEATSENPTSDDEAKASAEEAAPEKGGDEESATPPAETVTVVTPDAGTVEAMRRAGEGISSAAQALDGANNGDLDLLKLLRDRTRSACEIMWEVEGGVASLTKALAIPDGLPEDDRLLARGLDA